MGWNSDIRLYNQKINKSFDEYYKKVFGAVEIKRYEKSKEAQLDFHTDVIIVDKDGNKYSIDEKLRRNVYSKRAKYPLELISHIEQNKTGWLKNSFANWIVFGTLNTGDDDVLYFFKFPLTPALKQYVSHNLDNLFVFDTANPGYSGEVLYHTRCAYVHYRVLQKFGGEHNSLQLTLEEIQNIIGDE